MLDYPNIDPVALELGPLIIRWYSLAYIGGLLFGWFYISWMNKQTKTMDKEQYDSILTYLILGVIFGGRFGYVLFYKPAYFLSNPLEIFYVWEGGMSFHGGMLGVIAAIWLFCRKNNIKFFGVIDLVAAAAPIGLLLGRLANFINGELFGRATDSPLAMIFPTDPLQLPRHPSQLYQAAMEGLILFAILFLAFKYLKAWKFSGMMSGIFLIGYGSARSFAEIFREPDAHLGILFEYFTMGQLLSFPMIALGIYLTIQSKKKIGT